MTIDELPGPAGLRPTFAITVLDSDEPAAFGALRDFLHGTLADPGRAHAVRIAGELLLTEPGAELDELGALSGLGFDGFYLTVRQRWQRPRWTGDGLLDLTHELTVALRRRRLVALHTSVSSQLLRAWARGGGPYRFLSGTVLDAYERRSRGAVDVAPAWSRLTSGERLAFPDYLQHVTRALDLLDEALVAENTPTPFE